MKSPEPESGISRANDGNIGDPKPVKNGRRRRRGEAVLVAESADGRSRVVMTVPPANYRKRVISAASAGTVWRQISINSLDRSYADSVYVHPDATTYDIMTYIQRSRGRREDRFPGPLFCHKAGGYLRTDCQQTLASQGIVGGSILTLVTTHVRDS